MARLVVDDLDELRTLHRMMFTRKFDGPEDEFFGSPFLAAVQRRIAEALQHEFGPGWDEWVDARQQEAAVGKVRDYLRSAGESVDRGFQ